MNLHSIELKKYVSVPSVAQIVVIGLILTLLFLCPAAQAQSLQAEKARSEMADYVRGKYNVRYLHSKMEKTEHGPSGSIYVIGDLTPRNIGEAMARPEKADRARGIAEALILNEPDIFGAVNHHELREEALEADRHGIIHIRYRRYIGDLPLDNMEIMAHVSHDDRLTSISAEAVSVPPELYQAVVKETIAEDAVLSIIEQNLRAENITYKSLQISRSEKIAVTVPPYVIWQTDVSTAGYFGSWRYRIDAFTGNVIDRRSTIVE